MVFDPFSRLLVGIGRTLGEGLTRVAEEELARRRMLESLREQREGQLEAIRLQSLEQMRRELLSRANEIQKKLGFNLLSEEDRNLFANMVRNLVGSPTLDADTISRATGLFAQIEGRGLFAERLQELIGQGKMAEAGTLLAGLSDDEAERLLGGPQFRGVAEELRLRSSLQKRALELQNVLGEEQARRLRADTDRILALTPADVQRALAEANIEEARAETIRDLLQLQIKTLLQQVQRGEIELARLPEQLDASLRKTLTDIGLTEAQTEQVLANVLVTREQPGLVRAQTRQVEAQTRLTEGQARAQEIENAVNEALRAANIESTLWTRIAQVVGPLVERGIGDESIYRAIFGSEAFRELGLSQEQIASLSRSLAQSGANRARAETLGLRGRELELREQEIRAYNALLGLASKPGTKVEDFEALLRDVRPELAPSFRAAAGIAQALANIGMQDSLIKGFLSRPIPANAQEERQALQSLRQAIIRMGLGESFANTATNAIRAGWAFQRSARTLQERQIGAEIAEALARAALNQAQAKNIPLRFQFDKEKFDREMRYNYDQLQFQYDQLAANLARTISGLKGQGAAGVEGAKDLADYLDKLWKMVETSKELYESTLKAEAEKEGAWDCVKGSNIFAQVTSDCRRVFDKLHTQNEAVERAYSNFQAMFAGISNMTGALIAGTSRQMNVPLPGLEGNERGGAAPQITPPSPATPPSAPQPRGSAAPRSFTLGQNMTAARGHLVGKTAVIRPSPSAAPGADFPDPAVVGYASAVMPTEYAVGKADGNPLQLVHRSLTSITDDCLKKVPRGDVGALALCQAAGMVRNRKVNLEDRPRLPVDLQPWMTIAAAAKAHTLPARGMLENLTGEEASQNPLVGRYAKAFRNADNPVAADWVALNIHNHFLTFGDAYGNPFLRNLVAQARGGQEDALNTLSLVSYVLTFLPQKQERYTADDVRTAVARAGRLIGRFDANPALIDTLAALAEETRLTRVGAGVVRLRVRQAGGN